MTAMVPAVSGFSGKMPPSFFSSTMAWLAISRASSWWASGSKSVMVRAWACPTSARTRPAAW
jgi:hypothetical protein